MASVVVADEFDQNLILCSLYKPLIGDSICSKHQVGRVFVIVDDYGNSQTSIWADNDRLNPKTQNWLSVFSVLARTGYY